MIAMLLAGLLLMQPPAVGDAQTWKERGAKLVAERKLEQAVAAFGKACSLAPRDEDGCYYLGRTLYIMGRYDDARVPFEKALQGASKGMLAKTHRATALNFVALIEPDAAERHFREAVRLSRAEPATPDDPRIDYGAFLFRQGRSEEAFPILQQAAKELPASATAQMELGRVLLHQRRYAPAASALEKAVEINPNLAGARLLLGRAYLESGRVEEGERQMRLGQESWEKRYGSSTAK